MLFLKYKSRAGHPRFKRFRALGSLQFSSEHSLDIVKNINYRKKSKFYP